jgi:hypothetical protein
MGIVSPEVRGVQVPGLAFAGNDAQGPTGFVQGNEVQFQIAAIPIALDPIGQGE